MKWVYKFEVKREEEVEVSETKAGDKGEEITTKKKVKKVIPIEFGLKKPTRRTYDDAELFYGVKLSEGIRAGLLTKPQLAKRYDNDGGTFSDDQKEKYSVLIVTLFESENEIQKIQLNLENLPEEERSEKLSKLVVEMAEMRTKLRDFEVFHSSIFEQTAEGRAKSVTILWWMLNVAYWKENEDSDFEPLFIGEDFASKIEHYDKLEEEESPFWAEVISKLAYFVGFWYNGRASNEEDFKQIEELYNANTREEKEGEQEATEEEVTEEETTEEEVTEEETTEEEVTEEEVTEEEVTEEEAAKEKVTEEIEKEDLKEDSKGDKEEKESTES